MKVIFVALVCLIILSVGVSAFTMSNPNYQISGVIAAGGMPDKTTYPIESATYNMYITIGQPFTTGSDRAIEYKYWDGDYRESGMLRTGGGHSLCLGIYCTDVFQTYYSISVSGKIAYDYGDPVSSSEASLNILYGGARYEKKITTGPNGEFSATVRVPEYIANENLNKNGFKIQVYAKGRVEAAYTCNYLGGICK